MWECEGMDGKRGQGEKKKWKRLDDDINIEENKINNNGLVGKW